MASLHGLIEIESVRSTNARAIGELDRIRLPRRRATNGRIVRPSFTWLPQTFTEFCNLNDDQVTALCEWYRLTFKRRVNSQHKRWALATELGFSHQRQPAKGRERIIEASPWDFEAPTLPLEGDDSESSTNDHEHYNAPGNEDDDNANNDVMNDNTNVDASDGEEIDDRKIANNNFAKDDSNRSRNPFRLRGGGKRRHEPGVGRKGKAKNRALGRKAKQGRG